MKTLITMLLISLPVLMLATGITFNFAESTITTDGVDSFFEFDITAVSDAPEQLEAIQVFINYSAAAFGSNIYTSPATTDFVVTRPNPIILNNYQRQIANTYDNVLSIALNSPTVRLVLGTTTVTLFHVKILITNPNASTGISFNTGLAGAPMAAQQFYFKQIGEDQYFYQYNPVYVGSPLDETLPIELSSFTAVLNANNQVSLNWITQSETGVLGFKVYRGKLEDLEYASLISPLIPASNSSTTQSYVYVDEELEEPGNYYYWLENLDLDGQQQFHGPIYVYYEGNGSNHSPNIGPIDGINQIYPNPFNPCAWISYGLTRDAKVELAIYNLRGQLISRLVNENKETGSYRVMWNGLQDNGQGCGSGLYIVRMTAGGKTWSNRIMLVK